MTILKGNVLDFTVHGVTLKWDFS